MMMGGPMLPGMQGMGMSPAPLNEEQLKQLQVIMMQMQPQQIGSGVNVAQGMMTPEPFRAAPSAAGMGLLDMPSDMGGIGAQEQPPISVEGAQNLMDMFGNKMPAGDTFQRGNYIAGIDESEFKRPMSAGYNYTFGRNNDPDNLSDLEMALKRNNIGFPAY